MVKQFFSIFIILVLGGCASNNESLYDSLGGKPTVAEIVDNFIDEIQYDQATYQSVHQECDRRARKIGANAGQACLSHLVGLVKQPDTRE